MSMLTCVVEILKWNPSATKNFQVQLEDTNLSIQLSFFSESLPEPSYPPVYQYSAPLAEAYIQQNDIKHVDLHRLNHSSLKRPAFDSIHVVTFPSFSTMEHKSVPQRRHRLWIRDCYICRIPSRLLNSIWKWWWYFMTHIHHQLCPCFKKKYKIT